MSKLIKNMIWPGIILGILIAIIYYRAFLFTADFNLPVDAVINDASESLDYTLPSHELADNEKSLYNHIFDSDQPEQPVENIESYNATDMSSQPTTEQITLEVDIETESDSHSNIDEIVLAVQNTVNEALEIFKQENQLDNDNQSSDKASVLTTSEMLFKARLAYWNRDLKTAEDTYIELTELAGDPNAYGELGNLYYMQAKWKKASEAYYHAAIKLKSINHLDQAYHLLRIIRGLDSETANKLQTELQQQST